MSEHIKQEVRAAMEARGITQAELGRRIGKNRHRVSHAVNHANFVPPIWTAMLEALGLELVVQEKREDPCTS